MLRRLTVVLLVLTSGLAAQGFQDLVTNNDGSILYFASQARQIGSGQTFHSKIYRYDLAGGVRVVAEERDEGESNGCTTSNYFHLVSPQVSGDGAVFGYTAMRANPGTGRICTANEPNRSTVQTMNGPVVSTGRMGLSGNGRYAVNSPLNAASSGYHLVRDFSSGTVTTVEGTFSGARQQITDAGAVLSIRGYSVTLNFPNRQGLVLPTTYEPEEAVINRAGTTVAYSTHYGPYAGVARVVSIDVASGRETLLDYGMRFDSLSLTADGRAVIYVGVETQFELRMASTADGVKRVLGSKIFGPSLVCGDGRVIYYATREGALERLDVVAGLVSSVAQAPPVITWYPPIEATVAAGRVFTLPSGGGTVVSVCGTAPAALPKLAALQFQIPFGIEGDCSVITRAAGYENAIQFMVLPALPQFVFGSLLHANFSFISNQAPAVAGESVVAYMTGLGPAGSDGSLVDGISCVFDDVPAETLYAGFTSAYPGIYQVNLRVPGGLAKVARLVCRVPAAQGYSADVQVPIG